MASSRHHLGIIWAWFGHYLDIIWTSFGHHLGMIWTSSGHDLGIIWASFGHHLGIFQIHFLIFIFFFLEGSLGGWSSLWKSFWGVPKGVPPHSHPLWQGCLGNYRKSMPQPPPVGKIMQKWTSPDRPQALRISMGPCKPNFDRPDSAQRGIPLEPTA